MCPGIAEGYNEVLITIDTSIPCVTPRRTPDQRLADASAAVGFEITTIADAVRAGALMHGVQRDRLAAMGRKLIALSEGKP